MKNKYFYYLLGVVLTFFSFQNVLAQTVLEDFESGLGLFSNTSGNDVDWSVETTVVNSGSQSIHNAYTDNNTNSVYLTSVLDLTVFAGTPMLSFYHIAKTEGGYDEAIVEVSTDGGSTFSPLLSSEYSGNGILAADGIFDEDSYSDWGTSNTTPDNTWWKQEIFDLSAYSSSNQFVVRFRVESDGSANRDGWYLDDVEVLDVTCAMPNGLNEQSVTDTSATIGWSASLSSSPLWDVEYGVTGFVPTGTPTVSGVTANPYPITGLTPQTSYDFYVRENCGGGDVSPWSGPLSFETLCATSVAPYMMDFNAAAGDTPDCWTESGGEEWDYDDSPTGYVGDGGDFMGTTSLSGGYYAWIDDSGSDSPSTLTSPDIDVSGLTAPSIKFYMISQVDSGDPNATLDVEVFDGTTWDLIQSYSGNTGGWVQRVLDISSYSGVIQVRFTITDSGDYYDDIAIDDIAVDEMTACFNPNSLGVANVSDSSAEFNWVAGNGETNFNVEVVQAGTSPSGVATDPGVSNPYVKTGLTSQMGYEFYVQADCGAGDVSDWFGPFYFETDCGAIPAPYIENFDVAAGSLPDCWGATSPSSRVWGFDTSPSANNSYSDHTTGSGYFAYVDASSSYSSGVTLLSPMVDISSLNSPVLEFYVYHYVNGSSGSNSITVDVWDGAAWNEVYFDDTGDVNDWERVLVGFSSLNVTGDVQVRFVVDTDLGSNYYNDIAIDDVSIDEAPPCLDPVNVTVENVTSDSADIAFEDGNVIPVSQYNIEYGSPGFTPGTGTVVSASTNPFTLTNLSDEMAYEFYIQTECSANDISAWVGPFDFETTIDCAQFNLDITNTTDGAVCGGGSVTLGATASGTGTDINWYDSPNGGTYLGSGSTFETPEISQNTSFWVSEVVASGITLTGQGKTTNTGNSAYAPSNTSDFGLVFTANQSFVIQDVEVFSAGSGGSLTIDLRQNDTNGSVLQTVTVNIPGGGTGSNPVPYTVPLNLTVPSAGQYYLAAYNGPSMIRDSGDSGFPYSLGSVGEITAGGNYTGSTTATAYYFFYNWTVSTGTVQCESTRQEVIATVNDVADEEVLTLPYTQTETTTNYGNNYGGESGGCSGGNYLNSSDVVYHYQATDDYIMTVEMSGLSAQGSSVFVYESCADIGSNCIAGEVNDGTLDYSFNFSAINGQDYYVVVSGDGNEYDYTIDIKGETCANYSGPSLTSPQDFLLGQTLYELLVLGDNLTWYSDASGSVEIPENTLLVDGNTYYVTRTYEGCESNIVPITVNEGDCSDLEILSITGGEFCDEDSVLLTAEAAGIIGQDIYWYSAQSGDLLLGRGQEFQTPVINQTTSYWVSEIALKTAAAPTSGHAYVNPSSVSNSTTTNGLLFSVERAFTLVDVEVLGTSSAGGDAVIELQDANNDNMVLASTTVTVPGNGSTTSPVSVTVPLNWRIEPGEYRLRKVSGPGLAYASSSNNSFPYPIGNSGMITSGATATGTSTSYYFFFNWTIIDTDIACQSIPVEVVATRKGLPLAPYGNTGQTVCTGSTLADLVVDGEGITWYDEETEGDPLDLTTVLEDGEFYYASQTINGCEGDARIDVLVTVTDTPSDMPVANATQSFDAGDTLEDLSVEGENLTWYADAQGTNVITDPENTQLVDGETYYVTQTIGAQCESDLVAITVEETLSVNNHKINGLSLYPNPVKNQLTIEYANEIQNIQIFDLLGKKVIDQTSPSGTVNKIDVSHLASGAYVIRVTVASGVGIYKLIKE